jgi:hypothetical protein
MGRAGIEPDIENVGDLVHSRRIVIVAEEALFGAIGKPGIRTFGSKASRCAC